MKLQNVGTSTPSKRYRRTRIRTGTKITARKFTGTISKKGGVSIKAFDEIIPGT